MTTYPCCEHACYHPEKDGTHGMPCPDCDGIGTRSMTESSGHSDIAAEWVEAGARALENTDLDYYPCDHGHYMQSCADCLAATVLTATLPLVLADLIAKVEALDCPMWEPAPGSDALVWRSAVLAILRGGTP